MNSSATGAKRIYVGCGWACPRRLMDIARLKEYFARNGCRLMRRPERADVLIYIACGFIDSFFEQALRTIEQLQRLPGALIVGGCLWDIDAERTERVFAGRRFTTLDLKKIETFFPEFEHGLDEIPDANTCDFSGVLDEVQGTLTTRKRASLARRCVNAVERRVRLRLHKPEDDFRIRVSDGCDQRCTYCSHRMAIGPLRSKSPAVCAEEFVRGLRLGYRNFCLTAMDTGSYGLDIGSTLPELLGRLLKTEPRARFTLEEMNPRWLVKYGDPLVEFCRHGSIRRIRMPAQSGNGRVLRRMGRFRDVPALMSTVQRIKEVSPATAFDTQIIVGFPSETEDEFHETLRFMKQLGSDFVYIHLYCETDQIAARRILPKCPPAEMARRLHAAAAFCEQNGIQYTAYSRPAE
jgi:tRNA A37 methylthiotransferase MiaB